MVTIVLTYRNRSINIVKKCLDSLASQTNFEFAISLINYGSDKSNTKAIEKLIVNYKKINYTYCPTQKQLWNKSKAINIALRLCKTPYFFVGDIDMIFRNDFIDKLEKFKKLDEITYFQVGFLSENETSQTKQFDYYKIKHISKEETTGMAMYPAQLLKGINGFDEFYHGWGSEDTDVQIRLQNAGYKINFNQQSVLLLHQWHSRNYRTKQSKEPFHSRLEKINQSYLNQVKKVKLIKANDNFDWGNIPLSITHKNSTNSIEISNLQSDIIALRLGLLKNIENEEVHIAIKQHENYKSLKNNVKRSLGKKYFEFYTLQEVNDILLELLISDFRNNYYEYEWNQELKSIHLKLVL